MGGTRHGPTSRSRGSEGDGEGRRAGEGPFTVGDLRRTVETRLSAAGVQPSEMAQLQSHGLGGVQQRHYNKYGYLQEKRAALETLYHLLTGKDGTVTAIKRGRALTCYAVFHLFLADSVGYEVGEAGSGRPATYNSDSRNRGSPACLPAECEHNRRTETCSRMGDCAGTPQVAQSGPRKTLHLGLARRRVKIFCETAVWRLRGGESTNQALKPLHVWP